MLNKLYRIVLFILFLQISNSVTAAYPLIKSEDMTVSLELVADDLGVPWGMSFISLNKLLVTERKGGIKLIDIKNNTDYQLTNVPSIFANGQGGMLDIAVSPNYKNDHWVYVTYVKEISGQGATVLARGKFVGNLFTDWEELLVTKSTSDTGHHFGSRIAFDELGHVFFGIGDRGERENAQDLKNHSGAIMRLNLDGSLPADNPVLTNTDLLPEVWSIGHRNPQGMAYDADNKRLWSIEHGPRGGDEINLIKKGANYGWPVISYGKEYWGPIAVGEGTHRDGMEQPVKVYIPSIAPGSLLLYSGDAYPKWKGDLFSGALKLRHINRIVLSKEGEVLKEERLLEELNERIRALTQDPIGNIYFSTDSGKIFRLKLINK